jgi:hypothetical protein
MTKRKYGFALPYVVSGLHATGLAMEIRGDRQDVVSAMAKIQGINPTLYAKLMSAGMWHSIEITQADLDSLPDAVWAPVADRLGLKWSH